MPKRKVKVDSNVILKFLETHQDGKFSAFKERFPSCPPSTFYSAKRRWLDSKDSKNSSNKIKIVQAEKKDPPRIKTGNLELANSDLFEENSFLRWKIEGLEKGYIPRL